MDEQTQDQALIAIKAFYTCKPMEKARSLSTYGEARLITICSSFDSDIEEGQLGKSDVVLGLSIDG